MNDPENNANNPKIIRITVNPVGNPPYTCTPDPVPVYGANRVLQWEIKTDGWEFSTDPASPAIVIGGTDPSSQFGKENVSGNGKKATVNDKNSAAADFPYTVNLVHTGSGARFSFDPRIDNKGIVNPPSPAVG